MAYDFDFVDEQLSAALAESINVQDGMQRLLAVCAGSTPSPAWQGLTALDFAQDRQVYLNWLRTLLTNEPPDDTIKAFLFGLMTADINYRETWLIYLVGADEYDPNDDTGDWACDPVYSPDGRYITSPAVMAMHDALADADADAAWLGEMLLFQGYAALLLRDICPAVGAPLFLGGCSERVVAYGFDDGEVHILGVMTPDGWQ